MFFKISNTDYIQWDAVEAISFKRHEGLLVGAGIVLKSGKFIETTGDYAVSVWERMFPTISPHEMKKT